MRYPTPDLVPPRINEAQPGANANRRLSAAGRAALIEHEDSIPGIYHDSSELGTFGIGHLIHAADPGPSFLWLVASGESQRWRLYVRRSPRGTRYLDRSVRNDPSFSTLVAAATEVGLERVAARRYGRPLAALPRSHRVDVEARVHAAIGTEVRLLSRDPNDVYDQDLLEPQAEVRRRITHPLTQGEFDALVSFAFNVGTGNFRSSSLITEINSGTYWTGAPAQRAAAIARIEGVFLSWAKSKGRIQRGLVLRRGREATAFLADARAALARDGRP